MEKYDNWETKYIMENEENNKLVEKFYSLKDEKENNERFKKITYPHRIFNNWIKSTLIKKYINALKNNYNENKIEPLISVLDYGCGKGGDLRKYDMLNINNYIGIDISEKQLIDALNRKIKSGVKFPALFLRKNGSCNNEIFYKNIPDHTYFDLVSAQFCINYFFDSDTSVNNFLSNISLRLVKGGYFICTYPDSNVIVKKLRSNNAEVKEGYNVIENKYFSIIMENIIFNKSKQPYNHKYGFYLEDGLIGTKVYDNHNKIIYKQHIPEYLIIDHFFFETAKKYNLEVVEHKNFHQFYAENISEEDNFNNFKIMFKTLTKDVKKYLMDEELWDCSYLYKICVFKKTEGKEVPNVSKNFETPKYFKLIK